MKSDYINLKVRYVALQDFLNGEPISLIRCVSSWWVSAEEYSCHFETLTDALHYFRYLRSGKVFEAVNFSYDCEEIPF